MTGIGVVFQLANSAPPLSVTDSAIAPSARMRAKRKMSTDYFSVCPFGETMYFAILRDDSRRYRSKEQKRHENKQKKNECSSSSLLASLRKGSGAIIDALRTCAVCFLKTIPIPVKFDRQGHSYNFYGCFGRACCFPSESYLVTVLIASLAFRQPELCIRSQFSVAIEEDMICTSDSIVHEH